MTRINSVIQHLRRTVLLQDAGELTDGQLLECFVSRQEVAALEVLVRRHGPMVWGVCGRILRNHHDVEDAYQATFLVLVRKAGSIVPREMVGNWLYGVAHQTALKARATTAKRWVREKQVADMPEPVVTEQHLWRDLQSVLDQELSGLPDKYRVAIVLCDLEEKTRKEAAKQLGCPEGTLAARLTRGRVMLAKRLARHSLAVSGGSLAGLLSQQTASACVPTSVVSSTIKAVTLAAAATGAISVKVAILALGVIHAMFLNKLKTCVLAVLLTLVGVGGGAIPLNGLARAGRAQEPAAELGARRVEKDTGTPKDAEKPGPAKDKLRGEELKAAFLKAAGDDEAARALLAEVLKDAHRAKVLDEAVQHPERSGKLYAAEQWRLWQKAVSTAPGATEADIPTGPEIALSFLLGSHPSSADSLKTEPPPNDSRISEGRRAVESDLLCKSLQVELMDPKRRGPFARLMAGWMATRSDPWVVGLGLSHSRQYRLPEVVPVARQVVRNAKLDAQHRAVAALALADLGGPVELPTLRGLMDDKTVWSSSREGRDPDSPTLTVQLRDVAVGASLLLTNQDPGEFGFPAFRRQGAAELKMHEKLSGRWFAFTSDADRDAAHKKAKEWFDKQKKADPK
jgi:RNA polymerase sigma factor (sigma-70 family)